MVVKIHTLADIAIFIFRIDLSAVVVGLERFLHLRRVHLETDVSFNIPEGCIVGLICLGHVEKFEEAVGAATGSGVVVDEADKDALALGIVHETVLEILYGKLLVAFFLGDGGKASKYIPVISIVVILKAPFEELLGPGNVPGNPGGKAGVVNGVGIHLSEGFHF